MEARDGNGFEWTAEEIRAYGHEVVDLIAGHLTGLPERPVFRPYPRGLTEEFMAGQALPREGEDAWVVLEEFAEKVEPYPFGNGHPRFYGWVNGPPAPVGVFADALAAAMNPSCAGGNHAAIYVERQVVGWFRELLGLPEESMGLLVSGGSMATLTALAVARHTKMAVAGVDARRAGLQGLASIPVVYVGEQGHGCIRKAVEMLGIGTDNIRIIPSGTDYRMQVENLEEAIERDLDAGHLPIAVVANAGTVNTGAVDPLEEIARVCREHGVWLHVDGAYGAPAILDERYRQALEPVSLADSVALDPHKWLYVPYEAGLVLIRDGAAMRETFSAVPPYLRTGNDPEGVGGLPWFSEYGFQQTRGFRALKVWMTLKHFGTNGYERLVGYDIDLAEHLSARVEQAPDLELAGGGMSIVCFRYVPVGWEAADERLNGERLDELNKVLLEEIQLGGQVFLTSTSLNGRFVLRACFVNPRAKTEDVDSLIELVRKTGKELAEQLAAAE